MLFKSAVIMSFSLLLLSTAQAANGKAVIKGTGESKIIGNADLQDTKQGLKITVSLTNVPAGDHGFHIHEFGDCSDDGKNAGGHYNPKNTEHGKLALDGFKKAHAGDLGNITAGEDGSAGLELIIKGLSLTGKKYNVAGRAFILHEKPDDFGQPTGNAGRRIACGEIVISK